MAEIIIKNINGLKLKTNRSEETLLKTLQDNYVDWMHACGGKGRCTTCKFIIKEGQELLSGATASEERYFKLKQLGETERLACQAKVGEGRITIEVPEKYKLPHVDYSY